MCKMDWRRAKVEVGKPVHRTVSIVPVKMMRSWERKIAIVSARAGDILDYSVAHGDGKT